MPKVKNLVDRTFQREIPSVESARVQGAQTLRKGLSLLDHLAESKGPLRFKDLLDVARLPNGTLHRLLQTLVDYRLIRFNAAEQTYQLGARVFEMAHKVWNDFDIITGAAPELDRLRELSHETSRLGVLENGQVLVIDQRETPQPVRLGNGIGTRMPPHSSALGKALLAHLDAPDLARAIEQSPLEASTPRTIVDVGALKRDLLLSKARGYAISVEEQFPGVNSVAAPILDHRARPLGAVSVTGPAFRLTEQQLHVLGRDLIRSARRVSGNIGEIAMSIQSDPRPRANLDDSLRCVANTTSLLGEGPVWLPAEGKLLWVDILGPAIHLTDPVTRSTERFDVEELTSVVVPCQTGGYVTGTQTGIYRQSLTPLARELIGMPETDKPGNRFNDGKCDARGRFWAGTFSIDATPGGGSLYCVEPSGQIRRVATGFHISNGMGWSPDSKTFYFTDSGRRKIYAYDFDLDAGRIENRRDFVTVANGEARPDGLAVDAEGFVWSAHWDGWCVVRYAPDGSVDRVVDLPVPRPTSCAFGGADLRTLFVTSGRVRLSALQLEEAPLSGGVFAIDVAVPGMPVAAFAG